MIKRTALSIALFVCISPAFGQTPSGDEDVYRVTRTGGQTFIASSYVEQKPWHIFTAPGGKQSRHMSSSIASIVKLDSADAKKAAGEAIDVESRNQARTVARTRARVAARTAPPAPPVVESDDSGGGYGSGTHIGPRGGVYHYSASGNKVYSKRK